MIKNLGAGISLIIIGVYLILPSTLLGISDKSFGAGFDLELGYDVIVVLKGMVPIALILLGTLLLLNLWGRPEESQDSQIVGAPIITDKHKKGVGLLLVLGLLLAVLLGQTEPFFGALQVVVMLILVVITKHYAGSTYEMVRLNENHIEEVKKDRYINFLDKRLENLYTPLLNSTNELLIMLEKYKHSEMKHEEKRDTLKEIDKKLDAIKPYTHLAHDTLLDDLENIIEKTSIETKTSGFTYITYEDKIKNIDSKKGKVKEISERIKEKRKNDREKLKELRYYKHHKLYD